MASVLGIGVGLTAACEEVPGAPGEACNFAAEGTDGCDSASVCLSGTCHLLCSAEYVASPECGGGQCALWERAAGDSYLACVDPTGSGSDATGAGTPTGAGPSGGGSDCSNQCASTCTGNVPEQACYYCQAACLCRCAGDQACADENAQSACGLGTCGC